MDERHSKVSIHVLGDLTVLVDENPVELPASKKTRALLAFLAVAERPQRRERLCEIFWDLPDDPKGSLRWSLSKIRIVLRAGGTDLVIADRNAAALDKSQLNIDIAKIDPLTNIDLSDCDTVALNEAANLIRGPFLADLDLPRCPDYQVWRVAHQNRLELFHIRLLKTLIDRHRNQPEKALEYASVLLALQPGEAGSSNLVADLREAANRQSLATRFTETSTGPSEFDETGQIESKTAAEDVLLSPTANEGLPAIAVLPFSNLSDDPGQEYFADGISEDIITALCRIRWLFVIARNTTFTYKGQSVDVARVARELGVRYVLEGSVQRSGDRARITAQLIDGETGRHIWAERYDRMLDDVLIVQDEIAENISGAIEPQMASAENIRTQRKSEQSLDAWDLAIRAMASIREFTEEGSRDALQLLDRAIEIDPTYARAYSQKAWTIAWRIHQGWEDADIALARSKDAAEKAIRFDPDEPWAYIGWLFIATITRDSDLLLSSAQRAIELNPNFAMAHSWLGAAYALIGQGDKSIEWIEKARRLSPRDMFREEFDVHACFAYFQTADYEKAADYAARASMPRPDHVYPHLIRAASFGHLGQLEAAAEEAEKILRLAPQYSLTIARQSSVFVVKADIDRFVDGLRIAGIPE